MPSKQHRNRDGSTTVIGSLPPTNQAIRLDAARVAELAEVARGVVGDVRDGLPNWPLFKHERDSMISHVALVDRLNTGEKMALGLRRDSYVCELFLGAIRRDNPNFGTATLMTPPDRQQESAWSTAQPQDRERIAMQAMTPEEKASAAALEGTRAYGSYDEEREVKATEDLKKRVTRAYIKGGEYQAGAINHVAGVEDDDEPGGDEGDGSSEGGM